MAAAAEKVSDLEDVVCSLSELPQNCDEVSVADIQDHFGQRSFGPLLLVIGLIVLTPLGGIPGLPTLFGMTTVLISSQLLVGAEHFWLPGFITRRSVKAEQMEKAMGKIRPVAHWIDNLLRPRLTFLTSGTAAYVIAGVCVALGLLLPVLELVPFAAAAPALALSAFGLALVANDGLFALVGFVAAGVSFWLPATLLIL